MSEFKYQDPFPLGKDDTEYRLLTKEYVSTAEFDGQEVLKVDPEGLAFLSNQAFREVNFLLRPRTTIKWLPFFVTRKRLPMTAALPWPCCRMPWSPPSLNCRSARIPARQPFSAKKAKACGPAAMMQKCSPKVSTKPTPKRTCVTRRMLRSTCTMRSTPNVTCPPRLTCCRLGQ